VKDFLTFRRMIVPVIIQAIFWIGVAICVIVGLVTLLNSDNGGWERSFGLVIIVLGPIVVRIYCEFLIVVFRINETLSEIRRDLPKGTTPAIANSAVFCSKCGSENPGSASFCRGCGQSLAK
jgi:hypothetical protein